MSQCTPMGTGWACDVQCDLGFADCDMVAANGCEVDTQTDADNCGACGAVCSLPHATSACTGGSCSIAACDTGYVDCDAQAANGCEVDLLSDPKHCGGCGIVCSGGTCMNAYCQ
jgi:hypothetical protein